MCVGGGKWQLVVVVVVVVMVMVVLVVMVIVVVMVVMVLLYRRLRFCKRSSLQMQEIARTKRT